MAPFVRKGTNPSPQPPLGAVVESPARKNAGGLVARCISKWLIFVIAVAVPTEAASRRLAQVEIIPESKLQGRKDGHKFPAVIVEGRSHSRVRIDSFAVWNRSLAEH
jgi:hypothetical protein